MHQLLEKIFQKRGIKDSSELSVEELQQYNEWNAQLSKDTLTIEDIQAFLQAQVDVIKGKWTNLDIDQAKKAELIPYFTVYSLLLQTLESPKQAREQLEQQLNNLLLN